MALSQETFEKLIDRFEKEAHLLAAQKPADNTAPSVDEDAVCAICMDDECQNTNVILFCDACNLAVHQDCYGVPYIPEGQWLCRKCQYSPAAPVDCCLCPNRGGAFKQTDDGRWAHVLCALWIPEVGFGSVELLEPINRLDRVPPARGRLACSVCRKRNVGACIQCLKKNCYTAFHISCAQQVGLYMKIEPLHDENGEMLNVKKTLLCNQHKPPDAALFQPMIDNSIDSDDERPLAESASKKVPKSPGSRRKMRLLVDEKRSATPVREVPTIPSGRYIGFYFEVLNIALISM